MRGNWARTETVRGKESAANCMICGKKPYILEKGYCDGSHSFSICCPGCYNRHFKDRRETGIDITVVAENVYAAIRDWNRINARPKIAFLCKDKGTEYCHHTTHIEQARNFAKVGPNKWMEKEPKRGTWTEEFDESANPFFQKRWRCSACNDYNYYGRPDFCPCCGADMRSKEGGEK